MLFCSTGVAAQTNGSSVYQNEQIRVELVAYAPQGVGAGKEVYAGLRMQHAPQWHTYWLNPGDSGLATTLQWQLPVGVTAGDIIWPYPRKIPVGNLANYGFENNVLLATPLKIGNNFRADAISNELTLKLHAEWLVCKEECVPQSADLTLNIPALSSTALHGDAFRELLALSVRDIADLASSSIASAKQNPSLVLQSAALPASWRGKALEVFPENSNVFDAASTPSVTWDGAQARISVAVSPYRLDAPAQLSFLLIERSGATPSAVRLHANSPAWPDAGQTRIVNAAEPVSATAVTQPPTGLGDITTLGLQGALLAAFLGGLLLNLMPCVFPVIAVKVLSFAHTGEDARAQRIHGLAYSAGVILSFLALGGVLMLLRAGGHALGWGFQLQSPWVIAFLMVLFTVIALNLLGWIHFDLPFMQDLGSTQVTHPILNHVLSGVLAVFIASPCTAPFMGAALGAAFALPFSATFMIFAALGLGMALPYCALAFTPALLRFLPKPGKWMEVFKKVMAVPMLLTVLWLGWVGWQQVFSPPTATAGDRASNAALSAEANVNGNTNSNTDSKQALNPWQPWSPELEAQLRSEGRPVLVDYTAAWCITCQVNERTTLARADVLAAFQHKKVALLRADWTNYDPRITQSLRALGRTGIPVYALYTQGSAKPRLFSEILLPSDILAAINAL